MVMYDWTNVPDWTGAKCRTPDGTPNMVFFPAEKARPEQIEPARELCAACPCKVDCLEYALSDPRLEGIWAGTTKWERKQIRRERGISPQALKPISHGTSAGFRMEQRRGIEPCFACRQADSRARAAYKKMRKSA